MKNEKTSLIACFVLLAACASAQSTIDPANPYGYGANVGWINARADGTNGAVVGQAFCSGYLYSANCGWIFLGDGSPADGRAYANASATDFGVNHDGRGNLSGYAYGANIGWIDFEQTYGHPKVNLATGELSGYAWGANVGWIDLSGIKTLSIDPGPDTDADGIPDAWELGRAGDLTSLGPGDADADGIDDVGEYEADTDPQDAAEYLRITAFLADGATNRVTWPVKTTRFYALEYAPTLTNANGWATAAGFVPSAEPEVTETLVGITNATRFYRVKASPPLQ